MATRINQNELIGMVKGVNIASQIPVPHALGESMLQHKRGAFPFDLVMNANPLIIGIWHRRSLLTVTPLVLERNAKRRENDTFKFFDQGWCPVATRLPLHHCCRIA